MLPAFEAILGHKSAHSFETGPVIADPFISPCKNEIKVMMSQTHMSVGCVATDGATETNLVVHDNSSVVLEV